MKRRPPFEIELYRPSLLERLRRAMQRAISFLTTWRTPR